MPYNLNAVLRKKSFTGEDVGKVLILSLIDSYKQTLSGVRYPKPILPEAKMRHMIRSLNGTENLQRYHRYVGLNDWLMQCQPVAMNYKQQALSAIERVTAVLTTARVAEQNDRFLERLPVIMTQKQYDETKKRRVEETLGERDGRDLDLFALIGEALSHFVALLKDSRRANPLKAVIKKYREEPVKSLRILNSFESPPDGLTRGDILMSGILKYYPALAGTECADYEEQAEDFRAEFYDAYLAVATAIDQTFLEGKRGICETPVKEWPSVSFPYRELYAKNFFGVRERVEGHASVFAGNRRAVLNGVAILSAKPGVRGAVDSRGHYVEPAFQSGLAIALGMDGPPSGDALHGRALRLMEDRSQIEDSYYFALGFDKAIELIGTYVDLPDFDVFSIEAGDIAKSIEALNELSENLRADVARNDFLNETEKLEKLRLLDECFRPIRWQEIKTSELGIETAKEMLYDNMRAFDIADGRFLGAMTFRPQEDE